MNSKFPLLFKNKQLLETAFTHRSYLNEHRKENLESNERLEFLGDAVLELIVSLYLFQKYPHFPEGKLTSLRARLVQTKTLSLAAKRLGMSEKLKLSKGEKASGGQENESILANTFEAMIGAIYQDRGFEVAFNFVLKNLLKPAEKLFASKLPQDYKSQLQEIVQAEGKISPTYKIIEFYGPDHDRIFKVGVVIGGKIMATATGKSRQLAEQAAAKKALLLRKQRRQGA